MKVVEGDVNGEMQGGVMSPGAMAIEGSDLKVNGNVSGGLVSDGSTVTVNGNVKVSGEYMSSGWLCGADAAESGRIQWIFIPERSFRCSAGRSIIDGKVAQGGSCHRPAAVCGDRHRSADRKGMAQKNSGK